MRNSSQFTFWKQRYEIEPVWLNLNFMGREKGSRRKWKRRVEKQEGFLQSFIYWVVACWICLNKFEDFPLRIRHRLHIIEHVVFLSLKMGFFFIIRLLVPVKLGVNIQFTYSFMCKFMPEKSFSQNSAYIKGIS